MSVIECVIRPSAPPSASRPGGDPRRTLIVAVLGSSMAFLDGSVVNVALPVMQRDLHMTVGLSQWTIEAYALFLASLVLVGGALGDRLGQKRVFSAGVVLFAVASAACGCTPGAHLLVAARAVQGTGGALLVPGSLALISAAYPKAERGRAIGIWSMLTSITAAVGPIAGGITVSRASWRWVFFFNVPIAIGVLALAHKGVDDARDASASRRLDWPGALLVTLGLGAIVYALIDDGATVGVVGEATLLVAGAAVLVGFVRFESRTTAPMVPLSLFRSRTFAGTNLLTALLYGALGGALFFLPFNLIQAQGYDAAAAGAALLPFVAAISVLSPATGALSQRFGTRPLLVAGSLASALGYVLLALPSRGGPYWATYFPGIAVLGIGTGIAVAPLTTAVMSSVEDNQAGVASGVNNAVARAAGLVALAGLGVILRARFDRVLDQRLAALHLPAAVSARIVSERERIGAADLTALDATAREDARVALGDAYVAGFRTLMLSSAVLAAMGALAAWISVDGAGVDRRLGSRPSRQRLPL